MTTPTADSLAVVSPLKVTCYERPGGAGYAVCYMNRPEQPPGCYTTLIVDLTGAQFGPLDACTPSLQGSPIAFEALPLRAQTLASDVDAELRRISAEMIASQVVIPGTVPRDQWDVWLAAKQAPNKEDDGDEGPAVPTA